MMKLKKLDDSLKKRHKEWCIQKIKPKLEKHIKELSSGEEKKIMNRLLDKFEELVIGENIEELIKEFNSNNLYMSKIKEIFNYDNFTRSKENWGRHIFLHELNTVTCPYCNRQYITNYSDEKSTADLDHFYSQSEYPYLALNIYNFIPSCQICNRNFKRNKDMKSGVYPSKKEFGNDAIFRIKFCKESDNWPIPKDEKTFFIELENISDCKKIEENIKVFKLNEVYKDAHNKYIKDMLETFEAYPDESLLEISSLFSDDKNALYSMKELLKKPYLFKIKNNEPLGKLTKDILKSYGILEEEE